jgi:hypothetical protein
MDRRTRAALAAGLLLLAGSDTWAGYRYNDRFQGRSPQAGEALEKLPVDAALAEKILQLDPENLSEEDVRDVLSKAPAPQVLNIHGGIYPVYLCMISFSEFLIRMGYPEISILQPQNGSFSYSCYFDARPLAGAVAWHYERDAMRPMLVGHSQGGIQVVKVLHELAGHFSKSVPVWSPLTGKTEKRDTILDPFTGEKRPVIGVSASYATAVGAGGLTRLLPNQWIMNAGLRSVPDTVEEFTGFRVDGDFLGGDLMGLSGSNLYKPNGHAQVRNLQLPLGHDHVTLPNTKHLALNPDARKWINAYHPVRNPNPGKVKGPAANLTWAADVWYSIKKHWCLELQKALKEKQKGLSNGTLDSPAQRRRLLGRSRTARAAA